MERSKFCEGLGEEVAVRLCDLEVRIVTGCDFFVCNHALSTEQLSALCWGNEISAPC